LGALVAIERLPMIAPLVRATMAMRQGKITAGDWFKHRLSTIAALPERVVFIDKTAVKTNLLACEADLNEASA